MCRCFVSFLYSVVSYFYVSCSGSNTSVWGKRGMFCYHLLVIMWFL